MLALFYSLTAGHYLLNFDTMSPPKNYLWKSIFSTLVIPASPADVYSPPVPQPRRGSVSCSGFEERIERGECEIQDDISSPRTGQTVPTGLPSADSPANFLDNPSLKRVVPHGITAVDRLLEWHWDASYDSSGPVLGRRPSVPAQRRDAGLRLICSEFCQNACGHEESGLMSPGVE